ncbi:hypothetical protein [Bradyrhizobium elkanii]|uniref:hypothetical protein n=1 Tax=Bradyrhizobium elkanii TaxID=29448 RepID=UPI00155B1CC3|nr:hypothetical protein [Bradyrhizobium elkanii]MCP1932511.1 hypothetical protein [Bradyrhizobium elkanii]MCS3479562.1 hypothetical protein [Bradyrhizobium elkanii]MCS3576947.1 hypothetical protein [Bradyrhizobium elkanii]MCS3719824.1 hypothetical protein [Bradyrhizobium elkanii]MCS4004241.1 hypothetical protein [Bradyrhizobium elkanii USDA 61]
MIRLLGVAIAALFSFLSVANAAGTVPGFSLTPQFDNTGKIAPGCRLYVIQAGTVGTPQNSYQDTGLSLLQPNPMLCDATGRLPQWFVADGTIKLRLTDKNGVEIFVQDNLLVVGPSSGGGGGGGSVDPTTIASTGDMKSAYGTAVLSGWVRLNGRTIGSSTSGASERANADCQALFVYLWNADANLVVSGGRGANAAADWTANKTIALPDWRGRLLAGLDDMGNSAAGRLDASMVSPNATTLGASGGTGAQTLTLAQLPTGITSTVSTTLTASNYLTAPTTGFGLTLFSANAGAQVWQAFSQGASITVVNAPAATGSATSNNTGGSSFSNVQPTKLATFYIKL